MPNLDVIELPEWSEFHNIVHKIEVTSAQLKQQERRVFHAPLFRGVGNCDWGLETTLERAHPLELREKIRSLPEYFSFASSCRAAIETFTERQWENLPGLEFSELLAENLKSFGGSRFFSDHDAIYRYFVYLRHHGFPSPLLDWTGSPYIAAFFAFDTMPLSADSVAVYVIARDLLRSVDFTVPEISVLGRYIRAHRRHMMQQSQYTMCVKWSENHPFGIHDEALTKDGALGVQGRARKIVMPASQRTEALRHLDLMNINGYSLFGSEDSLMKTIARREGLHVHV